MSLLDLGLNRITALPRDLDPPSRKIRSARESGEEIRPRIRRRRKGRADSTPTAVVPQPGSDDHPGSVHYGLGGEYNVDDPLQADHCPSHRSFGSA